MTTDRLSAFSDGVIAVIITIMVLELKAPQGDDLAALAGLAPTFLGYVLSFVYIAIYWNNHHHFFHLAAKVTGGVLWANLHLLCWLSLIPFATSWLDQHPRAPAPSAFYGAVLLMTAVAWTVMQTVLVRVGKANGRLRDAIADDRKARLSPLIYVAGIMCAFLNTWFADIFYVAAALLWLIPHRRVEEAINEA